MTTQQVLLPGKTVVMANEKGGVGKTLLSVTLAVMLCVQLRLKVLVVDLCPQGSAGRSLGIPRKNEQRSIFDALLDPEQYPMQSVIRQTSYDTRTSRFYDQLDTRVQIPQEFAGRGPDLLPINERAIKGLSDLQQGMRWSMRLREILEPIKHNYDLIVIDTNPLIGGFIALGLCASDHVVIPVVPEELPTQGLIGISRLIKEAQLPQLNPGLSVAGIVFNAVEDWASHASYINEVRESLAQNILGYPCFNTVLEHYPFIATASKERSVVTLRFPYNKASKAMWALLLELASLAGGRARERAPQYMQFLANEEARLREERHSKRPSPEVATTSQREEGV